MSYVYVRKATPDSDYTEIKPPCWPDGWSWYQYMDTPLPPGWSVDPSDETHYPTWWPFPIQHNGLRCGWQPDDVYGVFIVLPNDRSIISNTVAFDVEVMVLDPDGLYPVTGTVAISLYSGEGTLAGAGNITLTNASWGELTGLTYTLASGTDGEDITLKAVLSVAGQSDRTNYMAVEVQKYGFVITAPANVYRDTAFNVEIQAITRSTGQVYNYTPSESVLITAARNGNLEDSISPSFTSTAGWSSGAKTVSCTVTGGTGESDLRIFAVNTADHLIGSAWVMVAPSAGFTVSAPATVYRGQPFSVTLQGTDSAGNNSATYTPANVVSMSLDDPMDEDGEVDDAITPSSTDATGWSSGAKTVSCTVTGGSTDKEILLVSTDSESAATGSDIMEVQTIDLSFTVSPTTVYRGVAFTLAVRTNDKDGAAVTVAQDTVVTLTLSDSDSDGDVLSPDTITILSGDSTGTTAVATISGGTGNDTCTISASSTNCTSIATGTVSIKTKNLAFSVQPSSPVYRDENLSMTIRAQDDSGNVLTTMSDTITVTLNGGDALDKFTSPTPDARSYTVALSSGQYATTTQQITGGSGTDTGANITASATGYTSATSTDFDIRNRDYRAKGATGNAMVILASSNAGGIDTFNVFGSDFTVEGWYYGANSGSVAEVYGAGATTQCSFQFAASSMSTTASFCSGGSDTSSISPTSGWNHIAFVRSGDKLYHYLNGSKIQEFDVSGASGLTTPLIYVRLFPSNNAVMDEGRISNVARYTGATYVVPTEEFVSDANTIVLVHCTATVVSSLVDSSSNSWVIQPGSELVESPYKF